MIRVVRTPEKEIVIDSTGKKSGRGAYVCPDKSCWEKALSDRGLERALEIELTPPQRNRLLDEKEIYVKS